MIGIKSLGATITEWDEIGTDGDPKTRLLATIAMFGANFHAEAVQVRVDRAGNQVAACEYGEQRLHAAHMEFGSSGHFETIKIGRRNYVLIVTPLQT